MCCTNVAFNMKIGECFNFFLEFHRLKFFWSLFSQLFSLNFFTLHNYMPNTHKHRLRGSDGTEAWLMCKSHTRHVYHAIGSVVLMCKSD